MASLTMIDVISAVVPRPTGCTRRTRAFYDDARAAPGRNPLAARESANRFVTVQRSAGWRCLPGGLPLQRMQLLFVFAVLALAAALSGCQVDEVGLPLSTAPPAHVETLDVDGDERTYQLHVPNLARPESGWPLVIAVHGLGSNATGVRAQSGFDAIADEEGFIAAYPDGLARAWIDAGIGSTVANTDIAALNLEFFGRLIDEIDEGYGLDDRRVYVAGISNGGMFSFHVACNMSDRVAAVGLVAAASISQSFDTCAPDHPVGYIAFHGTSDTVVPYEGGQIVPGFEEIGAYQSAHEAARFWAAENGCGNEPEREELPDTNSGDTSIAYRENWAPCESGRQVVLVTLDGSGHTWPGHPPRNQRVGATNLDIDASQMLWDFFEANPKPPGE